MPLYRIPGELPTRGGLSLLVLLIGLNLGTAHAAPPKPVVSWTLPSQADAGAAIPYSWTASNLKPGSRLVVQRQMGTARTWRTVASLGSLSGSGQLPGLKLGSYWLRIADIGPKRKIWAQQKLRLRVFGDVPFTMLLNSTPTPHRHRPSPTPCAPTRGRTELP
jgi:hypothetical protein